jgi:hypothetical protein
MALDEAPLRLVRISRAAHDRFGAYRRMNLLT